MSSYDHIVAKIDEPNPDFEAFYADMRSRIPALQGRGGTLEIPTAGFKKALKSAYLAGDHDAILRLINSPDSE